MTDVVFFLPWVMTIHANSNTWTIPGAIALLYDPKPDRLARHLLHSLSANLLERYGMKLNTHLEAQNKPRVMIHITEENYSGIREYIDNQVDHFLINSENWILTLFKKLPRSPSPMAVSEMEELINTYLSNREIRELNARFSHDLKNT